MSKKGDQLDKLVPSSKMIFDDFLKTYSISSHAQVRTAIRTLINETHVYDFSLLTHEDYTIFDTLSEGASAKVKLITTFFRYIYCNNIIQNENGFEKCYWNKEKDLIDFNKRIQQGGIPKKNQTTSTKKSQSTSAITMEQLERLILFEYECTHTDDVNFKNQRLAFCFYLLFFEDLQISTIRSDMDARNFLNGKLTTTEKIINIPEAYWDMLNYYKERSYSGFSQLDEYIRHLGDMVGIKDLVPNNITQKRKQTLFTCPECGKAKLSFAANWKSVNGILVCNDCTEKLSLSGQKKNIVEIEDIEIKFNEETIKEKIRIANSTFKKLKKSMKFPTDYIELQKFLIKIGELGEKFVYEKECSRLGDKDSSYADMVDATPASDPKNGFDIISYTENGEKIYIEVKTTTDHENSPFYMSDHERAVAENLLSSGANYQIHRIYDIMNEDDSKIGYEIYDSLNILDFVEVTYKVEPR